MINYKSVIMLALVGLVTVLTLTTGMDSAEVQFPTSNTENLTVESGEWFEKGFWDEELSDAELVEDEDGHLVIDNPSPGDEAVWRSYEFVPEVSHSFWELRVIAHNIQLTGGNRRNVELQIYCLEDEEVVDSFQLVESGQRLDLEGVREGAYEIRLVFETNANQSPRVESLDYEYLARYLSGFSLTDLSRFVVFMLLVVFVAGFLTSAGSQNKLS